MKTPRFWYSKPDDFTTSVLPELLAPFSHLFKTGTFLRRHFARPYRARVPLICIGNVVAGGAGKTPTALAIARFFKERGHKPVFVTRGYGGHGRLTCVNLGEHKPEDVGDEALLLAAFAPTWAGRDRVSAIRQAETYGSVIIMDDGFQNPYIAPHMSILVVDGEAGIGNGRIMPSGPLRESLEDAYARMTALLIMGDKDQHNLGARTRKPVFHAQLEPHLPLGFPHEGRFIAFAGIGRPQKFYATAQKLGLEVVDSFDFPDHHLYTESDINALRLRAEEQGARLLTTEKDAVRLPSDFRLEAVVLPVSLSFENTVAENALAKLCISSCAL